MTVTGGFPAPGPQGDEPVRNRSHAAPGATPTGAPQIPMLTALKPGIVSLRPLTFGDILDGAIKAVRFNPKSMVGLSALVLGAFLVPSTAVAIVVTNLMTDTLTTSGTGTEDDLAEFFIGLLITLTAALIQTVFLALATGILSGLLIHVVGQAVLGRKPDLGQTWRSTRGRLPALLGLSFLSLLFTILATVVLIGPGVLLLVNGSVAAGVILLILGPFGLLAVVLAVYTKVSLAAPAIVLEGHGVFAGLRRSFALTKGHAFWRVLGVSLVAALIASVVRYLLNLPFDLTGLIILSIVGLDTEAGQMAVTVVSHLSALLSGSITTPFLAAVTGLLYIDRRMRLEALDVVLLREAQSNPAPRI